MRKLNVLILLCTFGVLCLLQYFNIPINAEILTGNSNTQNGEPITRQESDSIRIVPLIPSSTELICAMGLEKYLVAASHYCNYPPEIVNKLPRIGDQNLNIEKIVSLKPTILLDTNSIHKRYEELFKRLNLPYVNLQIESPEELGTAAKAIGEILTGQTGNQSYIQIASAFAKQWEQDYSNLKVFKPEQKPRVYIEIWNNPIQACGGNNNMNSILEIAGGINIFAGQKDFPSINSEMMIKENPDIILLAYPEADAEAIRNRPGWNIIKAVKNGHIFPINQDIMVRPSPRNIDAMKKINEIINQVVNNENKPIE